ncbi:MAG: tyrosine-protein phosphatase [Desulfobacteraceae bacterium]|jgi:protein-tyrosine phosphatase|nr:tyrosine-protein phosphatase [Desulfobacteraceae bacterium]
MIPEINETHLNDVSLTRTGDDSVDISWKIKNQKSEVTIYSGETPDAINHRKPIATATGSSRVSISGLDPDRRHYFDVAVSDGSNTIISERRVPLEGGVNFRDLGGYQAVDGRRARWGQVFRSDNLGRLTARDVVFLQKMGIRLVCDFRTPAEIKKLPDRYPPGPDGQSLRLPIRHGESDPADTFDRIKNGDIDWMTEEYMINGYIKNIDHFAPLWATFFKTLAEPSNRPLVFHCTGGKDRAGVAAALVLLTLGVPEETVIRDHGLSNLYIGVVLESIYDRIRAMGVDPDRISAYFTAPQNAIMAVLEHLAKTYGSAANYLVNKAGVDEELLTRLKDDLLE